MDADAQGVRARRFKNRDNPSSRSTLRSRATLSPNPSSSSSLPQLPSRQQRRSPPHDLLPHSPWPSLLFPSSPPPVLSLSLSLLSPISPVPPRRDQSLRRHPVLTAGGSPLSVLPAHPPILLLSHHRPPSSPQLSSLRPNHRASRPHRHHSWRCQVLPVLPLPYRSPLSPFSVFPGSQVPAPFLMSDRGKAIAFASKKRKRSKTPTPPPSANYARNPLNEEEKENQLLPSTDPTKFPNLYCELRLSRYAKKNLNIEKKLNLPNDVRRAINARISELGLDFVDRDLGRINISWVKEFYCNFFRPGLDSVFLRGREIMITEDALRDALLCRVGTPETCAYQQAEVALLSMTFDYEALRRVIATPDASWVMDSSNTKPKGMLFAHLTREARTWQQIFAHYVFPTTHFFRRFRWICWS
ncbi:hypothetical protein AHAS_Ahas11G0172900 [Arachis hypogaea]